MSTRDEDQIQEIREIFNHYDHDKNGTIDPREFGALLDALSGNFTEEEARTGLQAIDRNANGRIEFDEFVRWWSQR